MPETAVDEDHDAVFSQDDVGSPRKALDIFQISIAARIQVLTDYQFRLGVLSPYPRHDGGAFFLGENIHFSGQGQMISAGLAPVARIRSEGANFIWRPRTPALTYT